MENRDIDRQKIDFFALLKFFLSKKQRYWKDHPDEFYAICQDVGEIHNQLCQKKSKQSS